MSRQTVKYRGVRFENGDDALIVPPLSLHQVEIHQSDIEAIGEPLDKTNPMSIYARMKRYIPVIHAALSRNYPDITEEQVKDFVNVDNVQDVFAAVMGNSTFPKVKELGEAAPVTGQ